MVKETKYIGGIWCDLRAWSGSNIPYDPEYQRITFTLDHVVHNVEVNAEYTILKGIQLYLAHFVEPKYKAGDKVWRATEFKGHEVAQVTAYIVHEVRTNVSDTGEVNISYILRSLCVGRGLTVNSNDVYSDLQEVQELGKRATGGTSLWK